MKDTLTAEYVLGILDYDSETGEFRWRRRKDVKTSDNKHCEGKSAGCTDNRGYVGIRINGHRYLAHRLAWLWMTGRWPKHLIDHIDLNKSNNRWKNLREATSFENARNTRIQVNNTSGAKGVVWSKRSRRWRAQIKAGGRYHYLGLFDDFESARAARLAAAAKLFGEFARAA